MLEVETTGQRGRTVSGSGRNGRGLSLRRHHAIRCIGAPWTSSSLNIRRDLHWLPVGHCITYRLCLTTWKTLHTSQPLYLSELISHYLPPRSLRSSNTHLLTRPAGITSNFSSRTFSVSAPFT